jgi:glycosyltransferase involved in cell wall biosynthesis
MDLAIVIPLYNEERTIKVLLDDIYCLLKSLDITYEVFIVNDGSTDNSLPIIKSQQILIPNIHIIDKINSGHGPSLYLGYTLANKHEWVLQIDSDYNYSLSSFPNLWALKDQYDLLLAERKIKTASFLRNVITTMLRVMVVLLYGRGVNDVNVPYRLIRGNKLKLALQKIKPNQFAPNVLITAFFVKKKFRIFLSVAEIREGAEIRQSRINRYILNGCFKSILDVIMFRLKI